ncbi:MAG: hypothetical protein DDT35_01355 [Firmicutes bacterium]|nr:hypothetical protein [Bacillota bacterium]
MYLGIFPCEALFFALELFDFFIKSFIFLHETALSALHLGPSFLDFTFEFLAQFIHFIFRLKYGLSLLCFGLFFSLFKSLCGNNLRLTNDFLTDSFSV